MFRPNAAGVVQLDACIMNGPGHQAGSVAALEGIIHPITVARKVMENTKHVMLVGEGARWFALEQGVESVDVSEHDELKRLWQTRHKRKDEPNPPKDDGGPPSHDTIALLVFDGVGSIAGGCSTSGAGDKLPGRVGDSPILGNSVAAVLTEAYWDMDVVALREREKTIKVDIDQFDNQVKDGELNREEGNMAKEELYQKTFTQRELTILNGSTSNFDFHYMGSAKIMAQIGRGFAEAMAKLLAK